MNWLKRLEDELIPPLTAVVQGVLVGDCRCELDLMNGGLRVVVRRTASNDERRLVRAAVTACAHTLRPEMAEWAVEFWPPQTAAYTSHIDNLLQDVRPFDMPSYFTVFELPLAQIFSFREAEARLAERGSDAARVVTFALGGISTLSRLSMQQFKELARPLQDGPAAADLTRERFHLFPGLNWRSIGMKEKFILWIEGLGSSEKILIFDTGSQGHAVRGLFNLLDRQLPNRSPNTDLNIEIVGIVDLDNPDSVSKRVSGLCRCGSRYIVTIEYDKIPRVLSEDFQRLVGYKALRGQGCVRPLRDSGLVRLVDESGKLVQITGSDNLANVFRGYMTNPVGGPERLAKKGREVLSKVVELAVVEEILASTMRGELSGLQNAWAIRLVSDLEYREILEDMEMRYEAELVGYPRHLWSFEKKRVQEFGGSDQEIWSEG